MSLSIYELRTLVDQCNAALAQPCDAERAAAYRRVIEICQEADATKAGRAFGGTNKTTRIEIASAKLKAECDAGTLAHKQVMQWAQVEIVKAWYRRDPLSSGEVKPL